MPSITALQGLLCLRVRGHLLLSGSHHKEAMTPLWANRSCASLLCTILPRLRVKMVEMVAVGREWTTPTSWVLGSAWDLSTPSRKTLMERCSTIRLSPAESSWRLPSDCKTLGSKASWQSVPPATLLAESEYAKDANVIPSCPISRRPSGFKGAMATVLASWSRARPSGDRRLSRDAAAILARGPGAGTSSRKETWQPHRRCLQRVSLTHRRQSSRRCLSSALSSSLTMRRNPGCLDARLQRLTSFRRSPFS
mmetsp:Transcript_94265/g.218995  ORF Transcript_94265/g.218995 Transcript_94265/m.218995 type:complete len:252 (-) Transcript_94265:476-1231(-)